MRVTEVLTCINHKTILKVFPHSTLTAYTSSTLNLFFLFRKDKLSGCNVEDEDSVLDDKNICFVLKISWESDIDIG